MAPNYFKGAYISTATTTLVKTGGGYLNRITIEGGTLGTVIVYDNTVASGAILASFDVTTPVGSYPIEAAFTVGCTVVTGAATKLTVSFE